MLCSLSLTSFALIDAANLTFDTGFHVLTGETGAGKTLLIQAIYLLSGHKVSTDVIRAGEDKATIGASFDIEALPAVHTLLTESGITFDPQELLTIQREISHTSKNRIFINSQPAPLSLLSRLGPLLLELISQNSALTLRDKDKQRKLLDLYGNIDLFPYASSYEAEKNLEKELLALEEKNTTHSLEQLKWERDEWKALDLQEGEEETLFEEYKALADSKQTVEKLHTLQKGLDHPSLIPTVTQLQKLSDNEILSEHLKNAVLHLQEASFTASKSLESFRHSPQRFEELEEKLTTLNHLKRKYHVEDTLAHIKTLDSQIDTLENLGETRKTLQSKLQAQKEITETLAQKITQKRQETATELCQKLTQELRALNLPHSKVQIILSPKPLSPTGGDTIAFFLAANPGETPASLHEKSSGGEVARFLFALKLLLAEKAALPTLIFDEIDANIGGETAALLGKKLHSLGKHSQVLAITHFPQVARQAHHHLQIFKQEKQGRTLTEIKPLKASEKEKELLRMLGGESSLQSSKE